jgi:hypothetical protein
MNRLCLIDSETRECLSVLKVKEMSSTPIADGLEVAPDENGEVGLFWNGNGWLTIEQWAEKQRQRRDKFLTVYVDSINSVRWFSMSKENRKDWVKYREELLAIPQQSDFPRRISWPSALK